MANDKKFVVKNGLTTQNVSFVDDITTPVNTITMSMLGSDTLSFTGNSGQLFSITDSLTGTIFAVNDISGVPSIEVDDDGTIRFAETVGNILVGTATDDATHKLQVTGDSAFTGDVSATTFTGPLTGNASTATAWATGRTITLTGDVTGVSAAFDGTANLSFVTTVADNSHNHTASNITDFDTEVANNSAVALNTAKVTNVTTNLAYTTAASTGTVTSSDGTDATIPAATTSLAGLLTGADKTKLDGIATGANLYVHPSDGVDLGAALTGNTVISDVNVNAAGHVTGFATRNLFTDEITEGANLYFTNERVDDRVSALVVAGDGIGVEYADVAGTLTISYTGNIVTTAITPPGTPAGGDFWYNSESGGLFIYYTDVTPDSYWVQVGGADGAGTAGSSGASPFIDTGTYVYYGGPRNVGIGTATPTEALHVIGNILASEDVTAYSDERLKTDITTISGALNTVTQLRGVNYIKKDTERKSIGVIAQEVQKVLPDVVHEDPDSGLLSVAYGNMVGVLIEAIKEQQDEITELKTQMAEITSRLDKLDGSN
jgi:ubiquinone biosynthesis protein UbiJ